MKNKTLDDKLKTVRDFGNLYFLGVGSIVASIHALPTTFSMGNNPSRLPADPDFMKRQAGKLGPVDYLSDAQNLTAVVAAFSSTIVMAVIYDSLSDLTQTNATYLAPLVTNTISGLYEGIRKFVYEPYKELVKRVNRLEKAMR